MSVQTIVQSGVEYILDNENLIATVYRLKQYFEKILLPDMVQGMPVTRINSSVFAQNSMLEEIYIPDSVQFIFYDAFRECKNLKEVYFYKSTYTAPSLTIQERAFMGCSSLQMVLLERSAPIYLSGESQFECCKKLEIINGELGRLTPNCFRGCSNLNNLLFQDNTYWTFSALSGCKSLKDVFFQGRISSEMSKKMIEKIKTMNIQCSANSPLAEWMYEGVKIEIV